MIELKKKKEEKKRGGVVVNPIIQFKFNAFEQ